MSVLGRSRPLWTTTLHHPTFSKYAPFLLLTRSNSTVASSRDPRTRDYFYDYRASHAIPLMRSFDPSNTAIVFQSLSSYQLLKQNLLFLALSLDPLTKLMIRLMNKAQSQSQTAPSSKSSSDPVSATLSAVSDVAARMASRPIEFIVRRHFFALFTGGENLAQCMATARAYQNENIRLVIDNSVEEGDSAEVFARNASAKKALIDTAAANLSGSVEYMALKMTSLCPPRLLEQMTAILNDAAPEDCDPTPFMSESQLAELDATIATLSEVCEYAKANGIGVWLDAEQFARQPAMNFLSRTLMQKVNADGRLYLFNTYQCYLKDALDWIRFDVEHAQKHGYGCGVKLVRGAYFDYEAKVAQMQGRENPVREGKAETDAAYDEAVRFVLNSMVAQYGSVGVALCTHNRASLERATEEMDALGIARDDPFVVTAQLKGMVDNLTYALGYSGYNALKLIPYGSFADVWPFLMRRFEENSQILNASQKERALYMEELTRRAKAVVGM